MTTPLEQKETTSSQPSPLMLFSKKDTVDSSKEHEKDLRELNYTRLLEKITLKTKKPRVETEAKKINTPL